MSRNVAQDVWGILRGLQNVANAAVRLQEAQVKEIWNNSSIKDAVGNVGGKVGSSVVQSLQPQPPQPQVRICVPKYLFLNFSFIGLKLVFGLTVYSRVMYLRRSLK